MIIPSILKPPVSNTLVLKRLVLQPLLHKSTPAHGARNRVSRALFMSVGLLSLTACISTSSIDVPTQEPAEIEDRAVVDGTALPLPEEPRINAETIDEPGRASPVVSRLMASASQQQQRGEWDGAASSLERALRIEPRNASLWSKLAEVKFEQRDWSAAIQLAAKSNTLSGSNEQLRRRNWYLMANAHEALGNTDAASKFREKLNY